MKRHMVTVKAVASGLSVSVIAGCGGGGMGGGSYGSSMTAMMAAPTASFSQPASPVAVNLGQAVTLAWSTANATSCTAMASEPAGGSFTGSQSMSGTQTVVPTAAGIYTYTLSCMGAGGNVSVPTPAVTVNPGLLTTLSTAGKITTIGSTIDPINGDQNPYGLTIAPNTAGLITAGDLIACDFNNGNTGSMPNTQGLGTTIVGLHPTAGSTPYRIAQSSQLQGCSAVVLLPDDSISASAWSGAGSGSGENPLVSATGTVATPFSGDMFANPWGEAYVAATTTQPAAIYVSNAPGGSAPSAGGTIDRISLDGDAQTSFTEIATGFCAFGAPGGIYGPSGLTYDPAIDTLYIVDTASASVVALAGVSSIPKDGVLVSGHCTGTAAPTPVPTFSGPSMSSARVIAHGAPFNTPLSAALLKNGDLVVGNADIGQSAASATTNLLIEVSPVLPGGFVGQPLQIDTTVPGALFGVAAAVDAEGHQVIYFNDDNAAAVMELSTGTGAPQPYSGSMIK
jgi:hypothetical protein